MKTINFLLVCVCLTTLSTCGLLNEKSHDGKKPEEPLRLLWSYEYTYPGISTVAPAILGNQYVITAPYTQYVCLNQQSGSLRWQYSNPEGKEANNNVVLYDSTTLYGKEDKGSYYFAVDIKSGKKAWKQKNDAGLFYDYVSDAVDDNHVYLAGDDSVIYVVSKQGKYQKTIRLQNYARTIIATSSTLYVSEAWKKNKKEYAEGRIVSYNKKTEQINWSYHTNRGGFYDAVLRLTNGILYSGTTDGPGEFVALDAATGQVKWKLEGYWCYRFTLGDGKIFINDGNYILAVDRQTGKVLWKDYFQGHTESNLAYVDGYLYHAHSGGLFVWDAQTGKRVARPIQPPDGSGFYNLNAAGSKVFVQSDFHLYAYRAYGQ